MKAAKNPKHAGLTVKRVRFSKTEPHPENPRIHPIEGTAEYDRLKASLRDEYFDPLVWNERNGKMVSGHFRRTILIAEGFESADMVVVNWDEKKHKARMIAANELLGRYDDSKLLALIKGSDLDPELTGMTDERIAAILRQAEQPSPASDAPPKIEQAEKLAKKWKVKRGQLWKLGDHLLYCGDSTSESDVAKLKIVGAELCFTSPPYSDQRDYKGGDLSIQKIVGFIPLAARCKFLAVNLGIARKEHEISEYWNDYIAAARASGLKLLSWNVWDQGLVGSVGKLTAMFPICHEWVFVFGREPKQLNLTIPNDTAGLTNNTSDRQKTGETKKKKPVVIRDHRELGTVLKTPSEKGGSDYDHPARFPVAFVSEYLRAMTDTGDLVYEPFSGSGTTLIACEHLKRKCRAMEISPAYVAVALQRFKDATGKQPEKLA